MGISSSGTSFPSAYCLVNRRREIALLPLYRRGGNKACHLSADCNTGFYGAALSPTAGAVPNADRASLFGGYCKIKQVTIDLYGVCGLRATELFKYCFHHNRKPPLIRHCTKGGFALRIYNLQSIYQQYLCKLPVSHFPSLLPGRCSLW